jgi:hypothetical protein
MPISVKYTASALTSRRIFLAIPILLSIQLNKYTEISTEFQRLYSGRMEISIEEHSEV